MTDAEFEGFIMQLPAARPSHLNDLNVLIAEARRARESERRLLEALRANMEWIGAPPTDRHSYDSAREDAWAKGRAAIAAAEAKT